MRGMGLPEVGLAWLVVASLLWALSFALIKGQLVDYDPLAVAFVRLALAGIAFAPLLVRTRLPRSLVARALGLGAVQFGLMYALYIASYPFLPGWAVALFTVFTPLYVAWLGDALDRRWVPRRTLAAVLAVAGAAVVAARWGDGPQWVGILLLQGSNLCFAAGQLGYRALARETEHEGTLIAWMYLGGVLLTGVGALLFADRAALGFTPTAWATLLYLGLVPTAVGFYLWNKGAARTSKGALAAANNLKIPLAVLATWALLREEAEYLRVAVGLGAIVGALFLADERGSESS